MPEAVADIVQNNNDILRFNSTILSNIRLAYLADMTKYVISKAESIKIEAVYNSIPSQLGNKSNKFQYSEIQKGARSRDYSTALEWLASSGMIYICDAVTVPQMPLKGYVHNGFFKIFLNDTGIMCNHLGIRLPELMLDNDFFYKGLITEDYVASQFVSGGIPLYYWRDENTQEVDFLLDTQDGIIPVEVKSGKNKASPSLSSFCNTHKRTYAIKIR
jgi:predicted AAA+ superfamily ATPase